MQSVLILFKVFTQSLRLSFEEIKASRLRSFLSLLGISIGVLCIVSVRTAVNSLEKNIQDSLASFGNEVLYVQKWPWIWSDTYPWWRYFNRPSANPREMLQLKDRLNGADACAIIYYAGGKNVSVGEKVAEQTTIVGASFDYDKIKNMDFSQGRYFTQQEITGSSPVALIGSNVAELLFPGFTEIEGRQIKIEGTKVTIIGLLKKEGDDIFGFTLDNNVVVPYGVVGNFLNLYNGENDPLLAITPKKGNTVDELKFEVRGAMRSIRRLSPNIDDDFAVNQVSVFSEGIKSLFGIVNIAGLIIGLFAVIVGGFGIANIMFVSVKERTYIIGIKKAIGAKQIYILLEFLLEAIVLCVLGGIAGLIVVVSLFGTLQWVMVNIIKSDFKFYITTENLAIGIGISVVTGIISGFIPAWNASRMRPVDAIRN